MMTKMLDLSTGHVSKSTRDILEQAREGSLPFRHVRHQYGWNIFVGGDAEDFIKKDFRSFPELEAIYNYACSEGCTLINFDRDADYSTEIVEFPTFEW